jgi:hypothetical protein
LFKGNKGEKGQTGPEGPQGVNVSNVICYSLYFPLFLIVFKSWANIFIAGFQKYKGFTDVPIFIYSPFFQGNQRRQG